MLLYVNQPVTINNDVTVGQALVPLEPAVIRGSIAGVAGAFDSEQGLHFQRQAEQLDESLGILLIVDIFLTERGVIFSIQAVRAFPPGNDDIALVEL